MAEQKQPIQRQANHKPSVIADVTVLLVMAVVFMLLALVYVGMDRTFGWTDDENLLQQARERQQEQRSPHTPDRHLRDLMKKAPTDSL